MQSKFRKWLEINEAIKDRVFKIIILNEEYIVSRESHIFDKRGNDNKPRDFNMSKGKYQKVFELFLNSQNSVNMKKPVTITWEDSNGKYNALSANINHQKKLIAVFGAIMNAKVSDPNKLYFDAKNRYHIGIL